MTHHALPLQPEQLSLDRLDEFVRAASSGDRSPEYAPRCLGTSLLLYLHLHLHLHLLLHLHLHLPPRSSHQDSARSHRLHLSSRSPLVSGGEAASPPSHTATIVRWLQFTLTWIAWSGQYSRGNICAPDKQTSPGRTCPGPATVVGGTSSRCCRCCTCTPAPLHLHTCTLIHLHPCTPAPLHPCTRPSPRQG